MLKRKTLTLFIAVATLFCLVAALGAQCITDVYAAQSDITVITDGFIRDENSAATVVGVNLPDNVKGDVKLVLPDDVTAVGSRAFEEMENLVAVELPSGLVTVGAYAFANTALTSIIIPKTVKIISEHAFHGCAKLTDVNFAEDRTEKLTIAIYAFASCSVLGTINIPSNTEIRHSAFVGCTSLLWVYVGEECSFNAVGVSSAVFFPTNTSVSIVFPSKSVYDKTIADSDVAFKNNNGKSATYIVNVNCFVGDNANPAVYERLHGRDFNYVKDNFGIWNTDTAYSTLPVQHASYASTTWYSEKTLTNTVSYDKVNEMLATDEVINLYCHETVLAPSFPTEPVSWVYSDKTSFDITNLSEVLTAMGCTHNLTPAQLSAIKFSVLFADENGNAAETPDAINASGVYSVTLTLDPSYGVWAQTAGSTITVNVDTSGFNIVLIVFLIVGILALIATTVTAIIRKKVQDRNKKKQLTQKEVLEKFKAAGGETTIIK